MEQLRDPQTGCPWDVKQTYETIAPYTIEEACEVADAIARKNMTDLREELGDLLLQVVFHAQIAKENGQFCFDDVVQAICDKMIRRHPHVFGDAARDEFSPQTWETLKAAEKPPTNERTLANIPPALPALMQAQKVQKKAARVGFDWADAPPILAKIREEIQELEETLVQQEPTERVREELGDLLFAVVNLARHLKLDAETALRAATAKFVQRFEYIEDALAASGKTPAQSNLEEMETLWLEAKKQ